MRLAADSLLSITVGVIGIHAALLVWSAWDAPEKLQLVVPKKLVVNTVRLHPAPVAMVAQPSPIIPKPKPVVSKAAPKPKPIANKKVPPKKKEEPKEDKKVALAKENVAKLLATRDKFSANRLAKATELQDLSSLDALRIDSSSAVTDDETEYYLALAGKLKQVLRLPQEGDVQIKLTLDRRGKVVSVETIAAANPANRKYVEAALPKTEFPPFGKCFKRKETHSFTITLTHEK